MFEEEEDAGAVVDAHAYLKVGDVDRLPREFAGDLVEGTPDLDRTIRLHTVRT